MITKLQRGQKTYVGSLEGRGKGWTISINRKKGLCMQQVPLIQVSQDLARESETENNYLILSWCVFTLISTSLIVLHVVLPIFAFSRNLQF